MVNDPRKASGGIGAMEREDTGNVMNVPLSDPRLVKAGIDPHSLYGRGITEPELQRRLEEAKRRGKK